MLPEVTLPGSLAVLPGALRPCFTRRSFATFCGLAAGLAGQGAGLPVEMRYFVAGQLTAVRGAARACLAWAGVRAGQPG
jgi:hypothetical protein